MALLCACNDKPVHTYNGTPSYMLYSPNGEPLNGGALGKPDCKKALSGWFTRLAGSSGSLTQGMFLADAQAQFSRMDIDHQGYLISEELDRFRAPYRQQATTPGVEENHKGFHHQDGYAVKIDENASMANIFDPVMSADANLDFRVTSEEFLKQAHDVFAKLDTNHDRVLTQEEVLASCPIVPAK